MEQIDISELVFDDHNFNQGTEEGAKMVKRSFEKFGAGRSVFIDKNNRIIAGNKSVQAATELGIRKVVVVDNDPDTLIAVRRNDVDLDSADGREMALADNATTIVNLSWDEGEIMSQGIDASEFGLYIMPEASDEAVDSFFDNLEEQAKKADAFKVAVVIPGDCKDQRKDIVKVIRETLAEYKHIKIAT